MSHTQRNILNASASSLEDEDDEDDEVDGDEDEDEDEDEALEIRRLRLDGPDGGVGLISTSSSAN